VAAFLGHQAQGVSDPSQAQNRGESDRKPTELARCGDDEGEKNEKIPCDGQVLR